MFQLTYYTVSKHRRLFLILYAVCVLVLSFIKNQLNTLILGHTLYCLYYTTVCIISGPLEPSSGICVMGYAGCPGGNVPDFLENVP